MSNELERSLVNGPHDLTVISLVDEGGIHKTTFARKVYNAVVEKEASTTSFGSLCPNRSR